MCSPARSPTMVPDRSSTGHLARRRRSLQLIFGGDTGRALAHEKVAHGLRGRNDNITLNGETYLLDG